MLILLIKSKYKVYNLAFFLSILLILNSCNIEKKIAREYVSANKNISILILPPDFVYKTNLKTYEIKNFDSYDDFTKDSLLFENSLFLKYISDSIFLKNYTDNLNVELSKMGFNVYLSNNLNKFLSVKTSAYILNIAQLEIEEYKMPISDNDIYDDTILYYKNFDINAININSWFEITKLNDTKYHKKLLYDSQYITDKFKGGFTYNPFTGKVRYKYSSQELNVDDIYKFSSVLGERYADYIYDYFLNEYIIQQIPKENQPKYYYHYNRFNKKITPASDYERFTEM